MVAKTSLLQVFELNAASNATANGPEEDGTDNRRLHLVGEYPLSGTVTALRRIKNLNSKSGGEAVLIATKNAKVSLVEWDPENHRISTVSIHSYEGENIVLQPFGPDIKDTESILTVDPSSRCAALKFAQRHLAILPFRQAGDDLAEMEADGDVQPQTNGNVEASQTPYKPSFVSTLTQVSPDLTHPIDLAFLYEYREPTLGILSSASQTSTALLDVRKDIATYTVGTLDLEQRASTVLISVPNLPSDLWKVVPLALPIGGALLVGNNELVHVDQSGKTMGVAVNEFAKLGSNLGLADQSQLSMKLEDCVVESLSAASGDLLFVLRDGSMAILRFMMQGRNVGGMQVVKVASVNGGSSPQSLPSCVTAFNSGHFFIGSDDGDSVLVQSNNPPTTLSRKRSHAQMLGKDDGAGEEEEEEEEAEEDDLYGAAPATAQRSQADSGPAQPISAYRFHEVDRLPSLGPINNLCFGKSSIQRKHNLEALASIGRGRGSRLAFMQKELAPEVIRQNEIPGAQSIWSIAAGPAGMDPDTYDNFLFVYDGQSTKAYSKPEDTEGATSADNYFERTDTEFEEEGETVDLCTLAKRTRIVQCRQTEIRTYDQNLGLSQIIPMTDEETDAELRIIHTSCSDPYLLVIRDDSRVQVLQVDKNGDVEPLEPDEAALTEQKWLSGCLYDGVLTNGKPAAFLLRDDGSFHIFSLPGLKVMYSAPNLPHLPPILSDTVQRRVGAKETLTELLLADIGPAETPSPYLVLRSATDMLTLYEPFHYSASGSSASWHDGLRFRKVPNNFMPKYEEISVEEEAASPVRRLRRMRLAGYQVVSVPGVAPSFIMRHSASLPKVIPLRLPRSRALAAIHAPGCDRGFASLDMHGGLEECKFPTDAWFGTGWIVRKETLGEPAEEVRHVAFHEERGLYVVATCRPTDFMFVEEDGRHPEQDGKSASSFPTAMHASRAYTSLSSLSHGETSIVDAKLILPLDLIQPPRLQCEYKLDHSGYIHLTHRCLMQSSPANKISRSFPPPTSLTVHHPPHLRKNAPHHPFLPTPIHRICYFDEGHGSRGVRAKP